MTSGVIDMKADIGIISGVIRISHRDDFKNNDPDYFMAIPFLVNIEGVVEFEGLNHKFDNKVRYAIGKCFRKLGYKKFRWIRKKEDREYIIYGDFDERYD